MRQIAGFVCWTVLLAGLFDYDPIIAVLVGIGLLLAKADRGIEQWKSRQTD